MVHVQLADPFDDAPVGDWIRVETTANQYDSQREDNYFSCMFDPVDDGNDEDDFFDPADPFRRLGPSSTCFPEFSYAYIGDTDAPFDPLALGNATQGPGLEGSFGPGTWIESEVDLSRFRAQYVRLRFLVSAMKHSGSSETWFSAFSYENTLAGDDGWFIDDFEIRDAVSFSANLVADDKLNLSVCSGGTQDTLACDTIATEDACVAGGGTCSFPGCGTTCNIVTAALVANPLIPLAAPGQLVELDAVASMADRCNDGVIQYRFWIDTDANQTGLDIPGGDVLVRNWSENPLLLQAPGDDTNYAVDARCSALTTCSDTTYNTVLVNCPKAFVPFPNVTADGAGNFTWAGPIDYAFAEGLTSGLSTYTTTATGFGLNGSSHTITTAGDVWLLLRTDEAQGAFCNVDGPGPWDGAEGSAPGRDVALP